MNSAKKRFLQYFILNITNVIAAYFFISLFIISLCPFYRLKFLQPNIKISWSKKYSIINIAVHVSS